MTEPKTTGVWSHLRKRFPAVNKCRQLWPDKITSHQDLVPSTMDLYIYTDTLLSQNKLQVFQTLGNPGKKQQRSTGSQNCCGQVHILKLYIQDKSTHSKALKSTISSLVDDFKSPKYVGSHSKIFQDLNPQLHLPLMVGKVW